MLTNIKGAIFDMDGTLIDSLMLWDILWKEFGSRFLNGGKFIPTDEEEKAVRTKTLKDAMKYLYDIYNISGSAEELLDTANEIMRNFYANEVKLKDGIAEFLEYCHQKGIKMCVASATDITLIKIAMKHCDIEKYFVNIFSCADIGKGKDKPDIYLQAKEFLNTGIFETCVFEDSLVAIDTAHKIGMKTVGIYDKYNFGHDEMKKIATVYVDNGETLLKLIR
ncbi:MAG: HAD family phosphatase [Clostridia bacterium]|nr:HAD family phosphatase [Clostridia bacterium]